MKKMSLLSLVGVLFLFAGAVIAQDTPPTAEAQTPPEVKAADATPPADTAPPVQPAEGLNATESAEVEALFDNLLASPKFKAAVESHADEHLQKVVPAMVGKEVQVQLPGLVGPAVREQLKGQIAEYREDFATAATNSFQKLLAKSGAAIPKPVSTSTTPAAVKTAITTTATPVKMTTVQRSNQPATTWIEGRVFYLHADGTYYESPESGQSTSYPAVQQQCVGNCRTR